MQSRWLKENKGIYLRVNRENSNDATKNDKRKCRGLRNPGDRSKLRSPLQRLKEKSHWENKQLDLQFGKQGTSRFFCPAGAGRAWEEQGSEEVSSAA